MGSDPSVIVAAISGILQAAQTWYAYKDSQQAYAAFEKIIGTGQTDPDLIETTKQLKSIVPENIIHALELRVEKCWVRYAEVLEAPVGTFTIEEIDIATSIAKAGICSELKRMHSLNGRLPSGKLSYWWTLYNCEKTS